MEHVHITARYSQVAKAKVIHVIELFINTSRQPPSQSNARYEYTDKLVSCVASLSITVHHINNVLQALLTTFVTSHP
jgi:hypothetical protein